MVVAIIMFSWLLAGCVILKDGTDLEAHPMARIGIMKEKMDCQDYVEFLGAKGSQYGCREMW
ncbi:MAG: hypothetical protein G8345_21310 [Magnetococcales bacterium]|nr:hypothetical protein [Magnetococcales bacterium]NGZ29412.1 hypothetical protein [Magnetococcales bacterium]